MADKKGAQRIRRRSEPGRAGGRKFSLLIYSVMGVCILLLGARFFYLMNKQSNVTDINTVTVDVYGEVRNPGSYRVPEGTTRFEVLQTAGIKPSSDVTGVFLNAQIDQGESISVDARSQVASLVQTSRLEFYFGSLSILSDKGRSRVVEEGMVINQGDRVLTEENTQAEISVGKGSRIDIGEFAEVQADKLDFEGESSDIELFQKSGKVWYKINQNKDDDFSVATEIVNVSTGRENADFIVNSSISRIEISCMNGLLLVERNDGSEDLNLITGQKVVVYDDGRPFEVKKISDDASLTGDFSKILRKKREMILQGRPFTFLFFTAPRCFILMSVDYNSRRVNAVKIPPNVSVHAFVQGFSTLQESVLYGGPVFARTLVEQIVNIPIPKYLVFRKHDIIRTIESMGGIELRLDEVAASQMGYEKQEQNLTGSRIVEYLKPSLSGEEDSYRRQLDVLRVMYEDVKSKNIVITGILSKQILSGLESNISADEVLRRYRQFMSKSGWEFKTYNLPVRVVQKDGRAVLEPILGECRQLLRG